MRPAVLALVLLPMALVGRVALASEACPALPARVPMPAEAVPGVPWWSDWQGQVAAIAARLPSQSLETRQLVFVGDSITAGWDPGVFAQFYGHRAPLLLGVSGDVTQGVLARLAGEWGPMRPRAAVLLIGTNNLAAGGRAEDIALGTAEIVRAVRRLSPETRVLVVGILPRGAEASDPMRAPAARVNALVARCSDGKGVAFADVGRVLLNGAGQMTSEVSVDRLHLTPVGYGISAAALEPAVARLLGE